MKKVLSVTDAKISPKPGAVGWLTSQRLKTPVMWSRELSLWLNPREWECLGGKDEAFKLWKLLDPDWGEAWNHGLKDEFPVELPIYANPKSKTPITMEYVQGKPRPAGDVLHSEKYWLEMANGKRKEMQWEGDYWQPFFPRPYQHIT